jgi:hypothetical protein
VRVSTLHQNQSLSEGVIEFETCAHQSVLAYCLLKDTKVGVFDVAVTTIFAREVLEGTIIIGQYQTIINKKSPDFKDEEKRKEALKAVYQAAIVASSLIAIVVIIAVAVPLGITAKQLDDNVW